MVLSFALMVMTACPFEVLRDESVKPPGTALAANGVVFLSSPGVIAVSCDAGEATFQEPELVAPVRFRVSLSPLRLTLVLPVVDVHEQDAEARTAAWSRWGRWIERVKALRRDPEIVRLADGQDGGVAPFDALSATIWEQQRLAYSAWAQQKTQRHEASKPFVFAAPVRVGTVVSADPEFIYWSHNQLCVVQGDASDGKFVRCYDPRTAKWSAKASREKWPRDVAALVLANGKPRAGLRYDGQCTIGREQDTWTFEELALPLESLPDDDVQKTIDARRQLEAECSGCSGMMCARADDCRAHGWGSPERDGFSFSCPAALLVSTDGSNVAFVADVTHDAVTCWANGYRCDEGTHEIVRSVLFVAPLQR